MRRRTALAAFAGVGAVSLAGCARTPEAELGPVTDAFDGGPTRPECDVDSETIEAEVGGETREFETASTTPYPDPPDAFGGDAVREYVAAFEESYVTHDAVCGEGGSRILSVTFSPDRTETFDRDEDPRLVFCRYVGGASSGIDDGRVWEAELGYSQVAYAVDETGAARVSFDEPRDPTRGAILDEAPDPVADGELVAVFE